MERRGAERSGVERLFFPPSQKCDCGTSKGLDGRGWDWKGEEWKGREVIKARWENSAGFFCNRH